MLHAEGFPCLTIKAYNGRLMVVFFDVCLRAHINALRQAGGSPSVEVINAAVVCRSICAWFDGVERAERYLTQAQADNIYNHSMSFLKAYQRLGISAVLSQSRRWKQIQNCTCSNI